MRCWREYQCIAIILGTILPSIDCVYLQLPDRNPPLAELKASQIKPCRILYPNSSFACAFATARRWSPCWMLAQLEQPGNYSVCAEMHKVCTVKMIGDAKATPGVINGPLHEY